MSPKAKAGCWLSTSYLAKSSGSTRELIPRIFAHPRPISAIAAFPSIDDKIYWGTADSYLVALDARTGKQVWQVQTADYKKGVGHAHPPLIADGKVIMGFIGGEREVRGAVAAYDAKTGEL